VIVDPQDPNVMYVADSKELYQSIDAGETWRGAMGFGVYNIGIDPQNSATLYAGTEHGVFKSTDRGGSWSWVRELGSGPMDVVFDPHDSRTIYASGYWAGIFMLLKSSDGGESWDAASSSLPVSWSFGIVLDPTNRGIVYARTREGLFKSTDGGTSWRGINSGLTNTSIRL